MPACPLAECLPAVAAGVLVAGDAEDLAVGQGVWTADRSCGFVVSFPAAVSIIVASGAPVQLLSAAPVPVPAGGPLTLTSSTGSPPGGFDHRKRKSHIWCFLSPMEIDKALRKCYDVTASKERRTDHRLCPPRRQCQLPAGFIVYIIHYSFRICKDYICRLFGNISTRLFLVIKL